MGPRAESGQEALFELDGSSRRITQKNWPIVNHARKDCSKQLEGDTLLFCSARNMVLRIFRRLKQASNIEMKLAQG
jgi:hypothetical protein